MSEHIFDAQTQTALEKLRLAIRNHRSIVVLSGAGISVPSGIPDFRSAHGLYSTKYGKYSAEEIISHDFLCLMSRIFISFTSRK